MEQITEFADTLDRFHKGSITDEKLSKMRKDVEAMNKAFNTKEMIHKFGQHNAQLLSEQLATINQEYKLKKITLTEMEDKKVCLQNSSIDFKDQNTKFILLKMAILSKLRDMDHNLTDEEKIFLEKQANNEIHHNLEDITPE